METASKHLREALVRAEANLASERKRREMKVVKAKKDFVEAGKKDGEKAIKVYKALQTSW